jgi:hypothetical protein
VPPKETADRQALEERFRGHRGPACDRPYEQRLHAMLDSGIYVCERLDRGARLAVKRAPPSGAERLV